MVDETEFARHLHGIVDDEGNAEMPDFASQPIFARPRIFSYNLLLFNFGADRGIGFIDPI